MKIVYSYYVLDLVHKGHILQMRNSKNFAGEDGKLVVGILTDEAAMEKKPKPIMPFDERVILAKAIKYADVVIPQETYSPIDNIRRIKPDILMESVSHNEKDIKEAIEVMKEWGGKVIITPNYPQQSSTNLKKELRRTNAKREEI
ncbi:MAG: adenylyltransferase/cytidyltransferase family protein [Candidatus Woesearchaeota archaeon]